MGGVGDKLLKLSKASKLILVVGIVLAIFASLGLVWRGQLQAQDKLERELTSAQTIVAKLSPTPTSDLETKLREIEAELQAVQSLFPRPDQSLEIADTLSKLAQLSQVEVTGVTIKTTTGRLGGITYDALSFELKLQGQVASFLSFVVRIDKELATAEIGSVEILKAKSVKEKDIANITINIYTGRKS